MQMLANNMVVIFCNIELYHTNTPYVLNLHNIICQLFLNKLKGKNPKYYLLSPIQITDPQNHKQKMIKSLSFEVLQCIIDSL